MINPLLQRWETQYEAPPFNDIDISHFRPAAEEAIKEAAAEIEYISSNPVLPDFFNTIDALDRTGEKLDRITSILFNLNNAETNCELQAAAREISPLLTRFSNDITLNEKLFARIKYVYEKKDLISLNREQEMLLDKHHRNFILGGAGLQEKKKSRFREISEELAQLSLKFEENILRDTNAFELHLDSAEDLEGLPENIIDAASREAVSRGKKGWIFTLHAPSYIPFMKYCKKRNLREHMFKAYSSRSFHSDSNDNSKTAKKIANLRLELSNILGFNTFSDLVLSDRMLNNKEKVLSFLNDLHKAAYPAALRDYAKIKEYANANGHSGNPERWDWAFYSERLRKDQFDIDDETLRPYFSLNNLEEAVFNLASSLFGISFNAISNIPVYHQEVKTWEVLDSDGSFLALLYTDYFPRKGKGSGAWMTSYREQYKLNGKDFRPFISIVTNFTKPSESLPSLLTFDEVKTFLHEFGHALHGMFSKCTYKPLSGTNVARDFVELPSQLFENYAYEKEWLALWARHYITGETIPGELIEKIKTSATYNEGYACNRQLTFGFLDMAWHTITSPVKSDLTEFESAATGLTEIFPPTNDINISVSFAHIFGGGYASGYYGYKWAETLDADAFNYLKEKGVFNRAIMTSFRKNILEKGGCDNPMNLYINFRGQEPTIDAFLERSGLTHS